jgi:hypothetical protein
MYTVELPEFLVQCPTYWVNFITDLHMKDDNAGDIPMRVLNQELKKYNAKYNEEVSDDIEIYQVVFKSEADFMWFKLKWQ